MTTPAAPLPSLTARQLAVALLVADGFTDKQIAARLEISDETVAFHVHNIADRIGVDRARNIRVQIACYFVRAA